MNNQSAAATVKFAFKEYFRPLVFAGNLLNRFVFGPRKPPSINAEPSNAALGITHEMIAGRAYDKWCARGCIAGDHQSDWNEAEVELRAERMARTINRAVEPEDQKPAEPKPKERRPNRRAKHEKPI